jgi:hypothetical protein
MAKAAKPDARAATKYGKALLKAGVEFELFRRRPKQFVLEDSPANLKRAEEVLAREHTAQWKGFAAKYAKGELGGMSVGDVSISFRPTYKAAKPVASSSPADLVDTFVAETLQVHDPNAGPEQLPSGRALLALDGAAKAAAVKRLYHAFTEVDHQREWGWVGYRVMGTLAVQLLRGRLPLSEDDLVALVAEASKAVIPANPGEDFERGLVGYIARQTTGAPNARVRKVIEAFRKRRTKGMNPNSRASKQFDKACQDFLGRGGFTFQPTAAKKKTPT